MQPMIEKVQGAAHRLHHQLGSSPLILFLLGGLSLLLWAAATVVQIQTSEYLALGRADTVSGVAWSVLLQPYLLVAGTAPTLEATSWLYGWVVELITLIFALALAVAVHKISSANKHLGRWFILVGAVLIILNGWADYTSSPGVQPLVKVLIAVAIGGIVTVGLPLGLGLIEHGVSELAE